MFKLKTAGTLLAVALACSSAYATDYIDTKPMNQRINVNSLVGEVDANGTTVLPYITWSEDMRTIFANGNGKKTTGSSIFGSNSLNFNMERQDNFTEQVQNYLRGDTPYLRGTMAMMAIVDNLTQDRPELRPVVITQLSWSQGGDTLVVKEGINKLSDLKGKTFALQQDGPHIHLLNRVLRDGGLKLSDVNIKWVKDLTNAEHTPLNAFYNDDIDASFVIVTDAMILTACASNCGIGDGSDDSVKGAKVLFSTKTASKIVADVYAVRQDYFKSNRADVQKFVHQLFIAKEAVDGIVKKGNKNGEFKKWVKASAGLLLDDAGATEDAAAMFGDAFHAGFADNVQFFTDDSNLRNFKRLSNEVQKGLVEIKLIDSTNDMLWAKWDFNKMKSGLAHTTGVVIPKFDSGKVAKILEERRRLGTLEDSQFLTFPIYFKPNQNTFVSSTYTTEFNKFMDYAATYGGAVITLEGHCDPHGYLKSKHDGKPTAILNRLRQSCMNLSVTRASNVRDSIITFAKTQGITLNTSQFETMGHGMDQPKSGMCGTDPCAIKSKADWLSNMRVKVGVTVIEAEVTTFEAF